MLRKTVLFFVLFAAMLWGEYNYNISNTNITIEDKQLYNYNRLRYDSDYTKDEFFLKFIGDVENYYGGNYIESQEFQNIRLLDADTKYSTKTNYHNYKNGSLDAKLYRLYGGYEDDKNRVVVGLQNIVMGVGRIWTPTNKFNPKNIYAIESDEIFGVNGFSYTRHLGVTSSLSGVVAQKADSTCKYALRYKTFYEVADIAIDIIKDNDTSMLGFEIEGDVLNTGAEMRSELAYDTKENSYEVIVGFDYGFVNGTTLIVEALYKSEFHDFYTAFSLRQSFNIFLDASLIYIDSFNSKESNYFSPSITYIYNDFNSFTIGAQIYDDNSYFFKWSLSF